MESRDHATCIRHAFDLIFCSFIMQFFYLPDRTRERQLQLLQDAIR
jgi:hypothetical protein